MSLTSDTWTYLIFGSLVCLALLVEFGVGSKGTAITPKRALFQTLGWFLLAMVFAGLLWYRKGAGPALEYTSAYLTEWSLSLDNIFVFVLLFRFFQVPDSAYPRTLMTGIILAIVFRVLFIAGGLALISRVHWILYLFGIFLIYTGVKMFAAGGNAGFDSGKNKAYRLLSRYIRSPFVLVVLLLAVTDIVFALDSIPAVLAISTIPIVVYSSNIFAVMGLRSLFFLLKGAVDRFRYLQQGVATVLVFIGAKMLAEWIPIRIPDWASLLVIAACLGGSILLSLRNQKNEP